MALDSDNPAPQGRIRHPAGCYVVGGVLPLCLLAAAFSIVAVHLRWPTIVQASLMLRAHTMCALFGMLGATLAAIRKYYRALISEATAFAKGEQSPLTNWGWGWLYYYMTRPLLGAVLGALSFTLSYIGLQLLAKPSDIQISTQGRYLLVALSFVSGFSVSHVLDRLDAVSRQVFKRTSQED